MESDTLDSSIATVEQQIRDVEASVMNAESEATRAKVADDAEERQVWLTEEQQLRTEEQQLRTEKQQLRDEKARKEALPQGGPVDRFVPELLEGLEKSNKQMLEQFKKDTKRLNGLLQDVRNVLRDMKHARESGVLPLCLQIGLGSCIDEGCLKAESKAFSACSETEAREMLEQAMLTEVQGWEQHPPDIPADAPRIEAFDYSQYPDEDASTPAFAQYHQQQLQRNGITFGPNGYKVVDLHTRTLYSLRVGETTYHGGVDAGVLPYGVALNSAGALLRTAFNHKQNGSAKAAYKAAHPDSGMVR